VFIIFLHLKAKVYRGMVKGLYSFSAFFLMMTFLLPVTSIWMAYLFSIAVAILTQVGVQVAIRLSTKKE